MSLSVIQEPGEKLSGAELVAGNAVSPVKSSAVLRFPVAEPVSCFLELSSDTNLNKPPPNWLRGNPKWHGLRGKWTYPKTSSALFSSLQMANNFTDCVGEVDVISDSENIKKLLKMPYSNSHISMMVHRIGKTLLLDEFDIHSHLLRESQKQWDWLRKFFYEHILESLQAKEKIMLRKTKSRDILQNKNMFSKFLYYSLAKSELDKEASEGQEEIPEDLESKEEEKGPLESEEQEQRVSPVQPFTSHSLALTDVIKEVENTVQESGHEFLRNVLWTFEDIRMLVGSDMPIFGEGTRPAVSLKLRDMQKPINILTGLDYWLDNLMCNVPEVVMCYHLNGIVQKYELLKTEEIPQIEDSRFSPRVVKDIAQNILSFLKSNAAKSGHTYWLFKGKNDDVVKLYDLTTLCSELMDEKEQNPFALPVAVLLYSVANNMKNSADWRRKQGTIYKLLNNSLQLLDPKKHPQLVSSVHSLLSDLFVPSDFDPSTVHSVSPEDSELSDDSTWHESEDDPENDDSEDSLKNSPDKSPSVTVKALCVSSRYRTDGLSDAEKALLPYRNNWEERCRVALNHVIEGLTLILASCDFNKDLPVSPDIPGTASRASLFEERLNMAKPYEPIPLIYASLKQNPFPPPPETKNGDEANVSIDESPSEHNDKIAVSTHQNNWKQGCLLFLLQKAARTYCALAELCCEQRKYGRALKFIKLGLCCHEQVRHLVAIKNGTCPLESLVYLLGLAGDVYFMIVNGDQEFPKGAHHEDFDFVSPQDQQVMDLLEMVAEQKLFDKVSWSCGWPKDLETSLTLSARCYATALKILPEGKEDVLEKLTRRLGNISNELGAFYMNQAARLFEETDSSSEKLEVLWAKSQECLDRGIQSFEALKDVVNTALLYSNNGRLMRLRAHACTSSKSETRGEFSHQERQFYNKAVSFYQKASRSLGQRSQYPEIWDSVQWELSTTLFTYACLLQDFAPLSTFAQEEIEKDVVELMVKSLKICEAEVSVSSRQPLYQYRTSSIYHRLASLYHNAYRNQLNDDHRKKQQKSLAEHYYSKACSLLMTMENVNEFMKVLLERIGLWELQYTSSTGFNTKLKSLHSVFKLFVSALPVLSNSHVAKLDSVSVHPVDQDEDSDEDAEEKTRLVELLEQRIQNALKNIVKLYSTPGKQRNEEQLVRWRELYSESLHRDENASLENHLSTLLGKIMPLMEKQV